jgi:rhomboid protease GluP
VDIQDRLSAEGVMTSDAPSDPAGEPPRLAVVYSSNRAAESDQRVLVLSAVGIHSWTTVRGGQFIVMVAEEQLELAQKHLNEVAREAPPPEPLRSARTHPWAWSGSIVYAAALIGTAYAAGEDLLGFNWFDAGALNGAMTKSGEWWRVLTALTLHADVAHLIGNLVFGVVLGYFASASLGAGIAWATIVAGAAMGNALDALWMPESQASIGASTAVFATLGLLSAYAWTQQGTSLRWARRWAPLIAGVILLGLTGVGGERTDVVAHITGFGSGAGLGAIFGRVPGERFNSATLQSVAAVGTIGVIALAWVSQAT